MSTFVQVDDSAWLAQLAEAERRCRDMTVPMRQIAERIEQRVRNTFRTQTDPWGNPWAEWKYPDQIKRRRDREGFDYGKLMETGALFSSIARNSDSTSASVSVGDEQTQDYADVHQFGNEHIRQRAMLPLATPDSQPMLNDEWFNAAVVPLQEYVLGAFQ